MGMKTVYVIADPSNANYAAAKAYAEEWQQKLRPGSNLSWRYNNDETKVAAKLIGSGDFYPQLDAAFQGVILEKYTGDYGDGYLDVSQFRDLMQTAEWLQDVGSPAI